MPQVKVTIDDKIYKQLKKAAKENFRTITNELNYRLQQSFVPAPLQPTYIPYSTPGGIPVEPYRITLTNSTNTEPINQTGEGTATVPTTPHEQKKDPIRYGLQIRLQAYS